MADSTLTPTLTCDTLIVRAECPARLPTPTQTVWAGVDATCCSKDGDGDGGGDGGGGGADGSDRGGGGCDSEEGIRTRFHE